MTGFEIYTLFICLFVYVLFVLLFGALICSLTGAQLKLIRAGLEDKKLKQEYEKANRDKKKSGVVYKIIPIFFCVLLSVVFIFSTYTAITADGRVGRIPTVKVVSSGSMSMKFEQNEYLFENGLDNQIQTFDLIVLHELPPEEELKLYDIVVYEVGENLLVHRIVGIEEPNDKHPDERYFLLQGDNVQYPDKFPVRYDQIKSIYRDERIPFVGSFVFFMQSPAGALCFLLAVVGVAAIFVIEKKLKREVDARIRILYPAKEEPAPLVLATFGDMSDRHPPDFYSTATRRTFEDKTALLLPERKAWLDRVLAVLGDVPGAKARQGKKGVTYLKKGKPLAKVTVSRGYVYVYLAIDPALYSDKKYGVKDVSAMKAYASYPARIKLTSQRKLKYVEQMVNGQFGAEKARD